MTTTGGVLWTLSAEALRTIDGDTQVYKVIQTIRLPGESITVEREFVVRLLEVNTPERGEDLWAEATAFAKGKLFGPEGPVPVILRLSGRRDVYGRWLGWVTLADGKDLSAELVAAGLGKWAAVYRQARHFAGEDA